MKPTFQLFEVMQIFRASRFVLPKPAKDCSGEKSESISLKTNQAATRNPRCHGTNSWPCLILQAEAKAEADAAAEAQCAFTPRAPPREHKALRSNLLGC